MSDGYNVDDMHFFPYPHKAHNGEIPKDMLVRDFAKGKNKFDLTMLKSLCDDHEYTLEHERLAEEALPSANRAIEYTRWVSVQETRTYQVLHEASGSRGQPNARVACAECN